MRNNILVESRSGTPLQLSVNTDTRTSVVNRRLPFSLNEYVPERSSHQRKID